MTEEQTPNPSREQKIAQFQKEHQGQLPDGAIWLTSFTARLTQTLNDQDTDPNQANKVLLALASQSEPHKKSRLDDDSSLARLVQQINQAGDADIRSYLTAFSQQFSPGVVAQAAKNRPNLLDKGQVKSFSSVSDVDFTACLYLTHPGLEKLAKADPNQDYAFNLKDANLISTIAQVAKNILADQSPSPDQITQ